MNQKALILIILISTTMATCGVMRHSRSIDVPITVDNSPDNIIIKKNSGTINLDIRVDHPSDTLK